MPCKCWKLPGGATFVSTHHVDDKKCTLHRTSVFDLGSKKVNIRQSYVPTPFSKFRRYKLGHVIMTARLFIGGFRDMQMKNVQIAPVGHDFLQVKA